MQTIHRTAVLACQALTKLHLPAAFYSIQVVVPSLGESITDGTIASVLKGAGDQVKENETIAQIETDKVTIDIKAPSDGTVLGVVVQEQDTVVPGQLVATLDDAAAKANLIGATPTPAASQRTPVSQAPAASTAASASEASAQRMPGIKFPPRIAADGRRISSLPAAEAHAMMQLWQDSSASNTTAAGAAAAAEAPAQAAPASRSKDTANSLFGGSRPAAPSQSATTATPSKFATSVTVLKRMPARRELSEKEMELIDLGGAA